MPTPFVVESLLFNHRLTRLPPACRRQGGQAKRRSPSIPNEQKVIFKKYDKVRLFINQANTDGSMSALWQDVTSNLEGPGCLP